jgi:hypothetical protein
METFRAGIDLFGRGIDNATESPYDGGITEKGGGPANVIWQY